MRSTLGGFLFAAIVTAGFVAAIWGIAVAIDDYQRPGGGRDEHRAKCSCYRRGYEVGHAEGRLAGLKEGIAAERWDPLRAESQPVEAGR